MDNHERSTLEQILAMLHGLIGRDDAKADFRPDLSLVSDRPEDSGTETLIFPSRIFAEPENEKSPPASAEGTEKEKPDEDQREGRFLKFTDKELQKMASYFKKDYLIHAGEVAHIRQKENGTFEIRYRRNGRDISRSGKTIEIAKARFIAALVAPTEKQRKKKVRFSEYTLNWMENVKKNEIKPITYNGYLLVLNNYAFPYFGKTEMKEIHPMLVQNFMNELIEHDTYRTAELLFSILKQVFDFAVAEDVIPKSPMAPLLLVGFQAQKIDARISRGHDHPRGLFFHVDDIKKLKPVPFPIGVFRPAVRFEPYFSLRRDLFKRRIRMQKLPFVRLAVRIERNACRHNLSPASDKRPQHFFREGGQIFTLGHHDEIICPFSHLQRFFLHAPVPAQ